MGNSGCKVFSEELELVRRHIWATIRSWIKIDNYKQLRSGGRRKHHRNMLEILLAIFAEGLKVISLYERGVRNAADIELKQLTIHLQDLPASFAGFTILQITDPHFDALPGTDDTIIQLIDGLEVDFVPSLVTTGCRSKGNTGRFCQQWKRW